MQPLLQGWCDQRVHQISGRRAGGEARGKFLRGVSLVRCLLKQGVELTWSNRWEMHPRMVDVLVFFVEEFRWKRAPFQWNSILKFKGKLKKGKIFHSESLDLQPFEGSEWQLRRKGSPCDRLRDVQPLQNEVVDLQICCFFSAHGWQG